MMILFVDRCNGRFAYFNLQLAGKHSNKDSPQILTLLDSEAKYSFGYNRTFPTLRLITLSMVSQGWDSENR